MRVFADQQRLSVYAQGGVFRHHCPTAGIQDLLLCIEGGLAREKFFILHGENGHQKEPSNAWSIYIGAETSTRNTSVSITRPWQGCGEGGRMVFSASYQARVPTGRLDPKSPNAQCVLKCLSIRVFASALSKQGNLYNSLENVTKTSHPELSSLHA